MNREWGAAEQAQACDGLKPAPAAQRSTLPTRSGSTTRLSRPVLAYGCTGRASRSVPPSSLRDRISQSPPLRRATRALPSYATGLSRRLLEAKRRANPSLLQCAAGSP